MNRQQIATAVVAGVMAAAAGSADAQEGAETRRAGATFLGDTGFWFVPTAEVLASGGFAVSAQSVEVNREAGFSNIRHGLATVAAGVGGRVELFGSVRLLTRIDRDVRPLFLPGDAGGVARYGGLLNNYPLVDRPFSGNQRGDVVAGVKVNLLSEERLDPVALAIRGFAKLPTGDTGSGTSTGETDGEIDIVISKAAGNVEVSGFAGFALRRDPDDVDISNSMRWGIGVGGPLRGPLQLFGELHGELYPADDRIVQRGPGIAGPGGSRAATWTELRNPLDVTVGVNWLGPGGLFASAGLTWAAVHGSRSDCGLGLSSGRRDRVGALLRLGYHSGVRLHMPPPPDAPTPPPPPANRPPTVTITCNPCEVGVGEETELRADARDPDGDSLTYRWNSPAGELQGSRNQATQRWRAPGIGGPVPVTVTVTDGRGGSASDTVTIQVVEPPAEPAPEPAFEDVHFEFDRFNLRPAATRVLDEVVDTMQADPALRIHIEGHTCNIGTPEYNLALGERRSNSVREYLVGRGISNDRLTTVSYGEERPAHDNSLEATRRLNRRAVLVAGLQ
ncbi:MAG: OmpA family protein [Acidobacteria bacterium]|nr:OmpA family protein [Acidobacteriota bacterium]